MLLHLSRASFWLAAVAAAWVLVAPGRHETALTALAGGAALASIALWRTALLAHRRESAGDAAVPEAAVLGGAALRDAAPALVRAAESAGSFDAALRGVGLVLKGELGARTLRVRRAAKDLDGVRARLDPPRAVVLTVASADDLPPQAAIELTDFAIAVEPQALRTLLELARDGLRPWARRERPVSRRVLLAAAAEDDAGAAAVTTSIPRIVRMLHRLGCRATVASGMLEALHAMRATQFDLVLMDVRALLPDAARQAGPLRDAANGVSRVPALVALAEGSRREDAEQRLRELGFDDCLFQPLRRSSLLAMLSRLPRAHAQAPENGGGAAGALETLDAEALARLRELDPDGRSQLVRRVLEAFQTSAARLLPQLLEAQAAGDRAGVRLVAHTLKSSSASIGALALSQRCAQLEGAIRAETGEDLGVAVQAMTEALDGALRAVRRALDGPAA